MEKEGKLKWPHHAEIGVWSRNLSNKGQLFYNMGWTWFICLPYSNQSMKAPVLQGWGIDRPIYILYNVTSSANQFSVVSSIPLKEPLCFTSDSNNTSAIEGVGTWDKHKVHRCCSINTLLEMSRFYLLRISGCASIWNALLCKDISACLHYNCSIMQFQRSTALMGIGPSPEVGILTLGHCHANTHLLLVGLELMCVQGYLWGHTCPFPVHCASVKLAGEFAWYKHSTSTL